ncbi:MAG: Gfo/Idh/MocA family oxidoreductase [Anaerolineaceae bacterium]|nr:MAG: Gfo/Idh/MocA family oxidoreductase [Anaerolineaceae bacterium]
MDLDEEVLDEAAMVADMTADHCFRELSDALEAFTADALICITPPAFHCQHATQAMVAGLDVVCEKPLATSLDDALAVARKSHETGQLVAVSQNYRYRPLTWTLQRLVQQGQIGELGQVSLDFYKGWPFNYDDFRRTMPQPLLVDMAIHHFDLLRFITGLEAVSVSGESWNPPWSKNSGDTSVAVTFTLENGARFVYTASWCAQGDFSDWNGNWLLEGQTGSLHYRQGALTLNHCLDRYQVADSQKVRLQGPPLSEQAYVLADLMAARREDRQPRTSVFDNLRSLAMVMAAIEAVKTGQIVAVSNNEIEELAQVSREQ